MRCPSCQHENRDGARFCEECATPLRRSCASCGCELRPTAKFCDECGTPVPSAGARAATHAAPAAPPPQAAEGGAQRAERERSHRSEGERSSRTVVTIVFADLVGSTSLHERLDAEAVRQFMEAYYAAMRGAVEAHGGRVTQVMGDGVKAVFGVPRVAEDDAIRAVRAGVAMQEAFRELAAAQAGRVGRTGLRVAVNTGEVVSDGETEIIGDPVNVAARLQEQGQDGDVVIGGSTQRLVGSLVTLERLGSFALKGRSEQVEAHRVVSLEPPAATRAAFVGRTEELARLAAVHETAVAKPAAQLAVLLGSPGLGKSRLIEEFVRRLGDGATVFEAHCDASGGATFAPLVAALRERLGFEDGAAPDALRTALEGLLPRDDAERERVVAGITALLTGRPASPEETFFVVRRLFAALARAKPVVLVIDDLQWAEPLLLDLVEHLIQWGSGVPLLVLIGARPELRDVRSSLASLGGFVADVQTLAGLDAGAAMQLAAGVIGAADLPAALAAKLLATSEGNPLFVGELVKMLVQEGVLQKKGERWVASASLADLEMPPTIHALLAARIERLRPEERIVLERAAVVGRFFSRSAVAALLRETGGLDARLEALRRSELIERDTGWFLGEPVLRFHHVLIRDAAYRRVLKGTRAELHARLAGWVEEHAGESTEHDETIGRHLELAHQHLAELGPLDAAGIELGERAAKRLAAAGRRALGQDDVALAANLLGRAFACLPETEPDRADLVLDWCEALLSAGDVGPAAEAIRALDALCGDSARLRAWHTCFAGQLTTLTEPEDLRTAADAVEAAARVLAEQEDAPGEAKAHFVHAQTLARLGRVGACEAALDQALAAARRVDDRRRANAVLAGAPRAALWGPSPVTRASGRCLDVVRVLRITQGAPAVEAVALSCQGVLEALRGRTDAAKRMIASARKMVEELGIAHRVHETDVFAGRVELLEGDASAAERSLRSAYDGLRALGLGIDAAQAAALLARALLAQGRSAEAEALSQASESLAGDDLQAAIAWRGARAEALAQRGEHEAAIELARAAVEIATATDALLDHADARVALGAALRAAGRAAEADAEDRRARELWETKGATLLAERTRRPGPATAREPSRATLEIGSRTAPALRRRTPDTAATRYAARVRAAIAARDSEAMAAIGADDLEVIDHPTGSTWGATEVRELWRSLWRAERPTFEQDVLGALGDSHALVRQRVAHEGTDTRTGSFGPMEMETFVVVEVDEHERARRSEVFDSDHLSDALTRLYALRAERMPEEPERRRARAMAGALAAVLRGLAGDATAFAAAFGPDLEWQSHRRTMIRSGHDAESLLQVLRATYEVGDDISTDVEDVLALSEWMLLVRWLTAGTGRESGGRFELPFLLLLGFDVDGHVSRYEAFEPEDEARALARFDALAGGAPPPRRPVPANAATALFDRYRATMSARDREGLAALLADDFENVLRATGARIGRREFMGTWRAAFRAERLEQRLTVLAALGDSLALAHQSLTVAGLDTRDLQDFGVSEIQEYIVCEAAANGLCSRLEMFAPDHLGDAIVRLYERYAELEPPGSERERAAMAARAAGAFIGPTQRDLWPSVMHPDVEQVDHRLLATWSSRGLAASLEHWDALDTVAHDAGSRVDDLLAATRDVRLERRTYSGTDRQTGGSYEFVLLVLTVTGRDGRITRHEFFDVGREAEALQRFDELTGGGAAEPFANSATRAEDRFVARFNAKDWAGILDVVAEHMEFDERRRLARNRVERGLWLEQLRVMFELPESRFSKRLLATRGERLSLHTHAFEAQVAGGGGLLEMEPHLILHEVDATGRIVAILLFDTDDLDAAYAELDRRFEAGEASGAAETLRVFRNAFAAQRWDELRGLFAPGFIDHDHRGIALLGTRHGGEAWVENVRALVDLAPDKTARQEHLRISDRGLLSQVRWSGTRDGSFWEMLIVGVMEFDADHRIARIDFYDPEQLAEAQARFAELGTVDGAGRFHNEAARADAALMEAFNGRDWPGVEASLAPDFVFDDRRRMRRIAIDRVDFLVQYRFLFDVPASRFAYPLVATRGERLSLHVHRFTGEFPGGGGPLDFEDHYGLCESDASGRLVAMVLFDLEALGDAYTELFARFEAGEGTAHPQALACIQGTARAFADRDWDAYAALAAPDFVQRDRRRLVWASPGRDIRGFLEVMRSLTDAAPDTTLRVDHNRICERGVLYRATQRGTHDGVAFENVLLAVLGLDAQGRILHWDTFDGDAAEAAFARFAELEAMSARRTFANFATQAVERGTAALEARDWARFEALFAADFRHFDRTRIAQLDSDRSTWLTTFRQLVELTEGPPQWRVLATRGERLVLARMLWRGAGGDVGPSEIDWLLVVEVDERGEHVAVVSFEADDLDAAVAELDRRFEAGEGGTRAAIYRLFREAVASGDWETVRERCVPDLVEHDHRRLAVLGTTRGRDAWIENFRALIGIAPGTAIHMEHLRVATRGFLWQMRWTDAGPGGGYEIPLVGVIEHDAVGRMARADIYDPEQLDRAQTRFAELASGATSKARPEPFDNAASRCEEAFCERWAARDWEGVLALVSPTLHFDDRRRLLRAEAGYPDYITQLRVLFDQPGSRWTEPLVATRGERLSLHRVLFEAEAPEGGGPLAFDEHLALTEVDDEGLQIRVVIFDRVDEKAAWAELDARFTAGEGAAHPRALASSRATDRAFAARDWGAYAAIVGPGFRQRDWRRLVWASEGRDIAAWIHVMQSLVEVAPDTTLRVDHVRVCARGSLRQVAQCGTHDGGAFENRMIGVTELDEQGRILRWDTYDADAPGAAFARFARIASGAATEARSGPFANAASRSEQTLLDRWAARDWAGVLAVHSPQLRFDDRRRILRAQADSTDYVASLRLLFDQPGSRWTSQLLATRGERLSLHRVLFEADAPEGGGPLAFDEHLVLTEVDAVGQQIAVVLFDLADEDAAWAELDARAWPDETDPLGRYVRALLHAIGERELDAARAVLAPDLVSRDHRLVGWGTLRGPDAYLEPIREMVTMAPDVQIRLLHTRVSGRASLSENLWIGTRDGGPFEVPFLYVTGFDDAGRASSVDIYDLEQLDRARARFEELAGASRTSPFVNLATKHVERTTAAWAARDWDAIAALRAAGGCIEIRRRLMRVSMTREEGLDDLRRLFDTRGSRMTATPLATRGEHLALARIVIEGEVADGGGPFTTESLGLFEVDATCRLIVGMTFDADDEEAARLELNARYQASDPPAGGRWANRHSVLMELRDWDAWLALYTPDFVGYDHRLVSWGTLHGPTAFLATLREMIALAPDVRMRGNHMRAHERGMIFDSTWIGTRDGGAFESPFLGVLELDASARAVRLDFYDPGQIDRAVARFEEIARSAQPDATAPRPNAAWALAQRWEEAFNAGDPEGERVLLRPDLRWEDRRPHAHLTGDLEKMLASTRTRADLGARAECRLLGTAGERIAIGKLLYHGGPEEGRFEIEAILVVECDAAGRGVATINFDADQRRAAQDEAWRRWARIEPAVAEPTRMLGEAIDRFNARDRARVRSRITDDFVVEDHRRTGLGRIEALEVYLDSLSALWQMVPDAVVEAGWHWLAWDPRGGLTVIRHHGTLRDGGAFENVYLYLFWLRGKLLERLEFFELEAADEALRRFETLRGDAARAPSGLSNLATEAMERWSAHLELALTRGDWELLRASATPDMRFEDRTRFAGVAGDRDFYVEAVRARAGLGARPEVTILGVAGDRIAISRSLWVGGPADGRFEMEFFVVSEVDDAGLLRAMILCEDARSAQREAWARWAAIDPARAAVTKPLGEIIDAYEPPDHPRAVAALAEHVVLEDHRRTGVGRIEGAAAYSKSVEALFELARESHVEAGWRWLACEPWGAITVMRRFGVLPEGGEFESEYLYLYTVSGGRITRVEQFEPEDQGAALARFEALRPSADPLAIPPNAVCRAIEGVMHLRISEGPAALETRVTSDFRYEDHSRHSLVSGGLEEWQRALSFLATEIRVRPAARLVATAGERLALHHVVLRDPADPTRFEIENFRLVESDAAGKLRALVIFGGDDRAGAFAALESRFVAIANDGVPAAVTALGRAISSRDPDLVRACLRDDFVYHDHRRTGAGRIEGADAYLPSAASWFELTRATHVESLCTLAAGSHGEVVLNRWAGENLEGGAFELHWVGVVLVGDGKIVRLELFEPEDREEAIARFEALRPTADPLAIPPNTASRSFDEIKRVRERDGVEAVPSLVAGGFRFEDRTRRSLTSGGLDDWMRSQEFLTNELGGRSEGRLLATAGDRLALSHFAWRQVDDPDRYVISGDVLIEIDGNGRLLALLLFDADAPGAAFAELAERWALQDDAPPAPAIEFLRRWNAHDADGLRGVLAPDFVFDDHRRTGIGRTDREGWLAALAALWELGPDTRLDTLYAIDQRPDALLALTHWWGTNAEGGAFESIFVSVAHAHGESVRSVSLYEADDLEAARAHFEALRPDPPALPENSATRAESRWTRAVMRRDWEGVRSLVRPDFMFEDRGRRALVRGGVEAWIASADYTTSLPGIRIDKPRLAAIGDRVAIHHIRWSGSPGGDGFEFERLRVLEVDAEGLFVAAVLFDPEDATAASVDAFARFAAGEAAGSPGVARFLAFLRALVARDSAAAGACFAPGLVFEDHRPLGLGALSGEAFVASVAALDELGDDITMEILRVVAWNAKGAVVSVRRRGTVRGGGAFESGFLVLVLGTAERFIRYEVFAEDAVERARARFAELSEGV